MEANSTVNFYETGELITGELIPHLSVKTPLYNSNRDIVGSIGSSVNLTELEKYKYAINDPIKKIDMIHQFPVLKSPNSINFIFKKINNKYIIKTEKNQHVYLSEREMQVLYCIFLGYTAKESGKILRLSFRTVEKFTSNVMVKLGYRSRSQIVSIILETFFIGVLVPVFANWLYFSK